jgi:hypothetical protein
VPKQIAVAVKSQQTAGASLFVQRKCACGAGSSSLTGECEECRKKKVVGLQTKRRVNEPGDVYEQEADRVAEQVLAMPAHPDVSGAPPRVQRFSAQSSGQMSAAPASVDLVLGGPGRPLDRPLRHDMERRFGFDFSRVRVHVDAASAESAGHIDARAYTAGHHIVFGANQFSPRTLAGRRLLAHELTHVVQQTGGGAGALRRDVVQREPAFSPFPPAEDLLDAYKWQMAADDFDDIARRLEIAFRTHPEPERYLQEVFEEAADDYSSWEDSIAASFVSRLKPHDLDRLAGSSGGRYALSQMYVAMITGSPTAFEREQSTRVLYAKMRQYSPETFLKLAKKQPTGRPTRIFPIRFMRVTGGAYAPPVATLRDDGMVRVAYPRNTAFQGAFQRELKTIGNFVGGDGDLISANEIVIIKDYENGGVELPMPALALVDYANRSTHSTIGKIVEVSAFAATFGVGSGAAAAGELGAEQAAVRITATAIWGQRLAKVARVLDVAADVVSVAAFVIDENRDWIVEKLGRAGEWLVRISDTLNMAASVYGFARLGQAGIRYAREFRKASAAARSRAKGLTNAEASVIDEIDDKLGKLVNELDEEAAKKAKAKGDAAADELPGAKPHADDAKAGSTSGSKKSASDNDIIRESAKVHGLHPKTLQGEVDDMSRQLRDPDNVILPENPNLDIELSTQHSGEPHHFERKRADRTWCRHSDEVCELELGGEFNKKADDGVKKAQDEIAAPLKPTHKTPFNMKDIDAPFDPPPQMLGTNLSAVSLKPGQEALYILRDSSGAVLKVGKTSELAAKGRFSVYKRGGKSTNTLVEIEVYPLRVRPDPLPKGAHTTEYYEAKLRKFMEDNKETMPWDNTGGRLGRPGFGTPGEGVRTSLIPREQMEALLEFYRGNRKQVGAVLGIHPQTVGLWAKSLGLNTKNFKVKKPK